MQYHVAKNGEKSGPFEKEEVYRRLVAGEFAGTDLGWHEGMGEWEPLAKLLPPQTTAIPAGAPVFRPTVTRPNMVPQQTQTSGMAIASMICGILGLLLWLPCIPAIILGHLGLSAIKKSAGALGGKGMAVAGLVMGYLMIALIPIIAILAAIAIPAFTQAQTRANEMKAVNNARQIVIGMKQYAVDHEGKYPATLDVLFEEQILMDRKLLEFPPQIDVPGQGWEYLGAGHTDSDPGNLIILTSRKADRTKKKIIARNDGSAQVVRESEVP
jgi:type II secretory pathway pseudopilin PulG